ncbi:wax ester/triacylglycerol synthase family O-acyltransferase [Parahaliea mediterranea]|uniref:diacylglycerol O-acyltransferase n=1 Tax=Parahaliea mediterranea TaxID=651086 RepID=A0A939IJD0_9GAMM|nr:wax ester/triacylglycerol synthase family O-acyltransferase [Parahaliea mediterranea]MBN7796156.1 wax ester/triacylglycerol synthase family O-acyltransferase [Parahaliea mediterranea]
MQQLSGQDAMFLHAELKGLPQHIGGVSIYDPSSAPGGRPGFAAIHDMLQSRLHLSPIFRRKLAPVPFGLGQPYWTEDTHFDLEYHLRHIALPKPGDWRQLCILAARLHAVPLARDKPLWEMYVIEGLDGVEGLPPGCFALLLKVHHAAMDGATGARFMGIVHDRSPEPAPAPPAPPWIVEKPSPLGMLGRAYLDAWRLPGKLWHLASDAVPTALRLRRGYAEHRFEHLGKLPRTRFQGPISPHRVVEAREFDFGKIRAMKNAAPGATVNDVMLAIVSGGLRRYLDARGELPAQSLAAGCPIDVRSDSERASGGNMVGFMGLSLCSHIADPRERLLAIHRKSVEAKDYAQALGPRIALDITDLIPGSVLGVALRAAAVTGLAESSVVMNTVVTNVPGPPFAQYLCGAELIRNFCLGPLFPNVGLFHVVYSTVQHGEGTISLSFTACRQMLPDPEFYARCLQEAFDELAKALLPAAARKRTAARRKRGAGA